MTDTQLKKLRAHQKSLSAQRDALVAAEERRDAKVQVEEAHAIQKEVAELLRDFPGLVPEFDDAMIAEGARWVRIAGLRAYLTRVVAALDAELEEVERTGAVYELRDFSFVLDERLRAIIERDYVDAQKCLSAGSWKSVIVLAGGCIEGLLLDMLQQHPETRQAATRGKSADLSRWDLIELINVAVELQLVGVGVDRFSDSVREFRNLIHPGNEVRTGLTVSSESATIAFEVLKMLQADLEGRARA